MTECSETLFPFEAHFSRQVIGQFTRDRLTTDGGALLLRQADRKISLLRRLQRAYHGLIVPILGFILLPLTTLVYAWITNSALPLAGLNLVILIVAVVVDLGGWGGGEYHRRTRWSD